MRIIAADDEVLALELLTNSIKQVRPDAEVYPFRNLSDLLHFAEETPCDVAFLDIRMRGMDGVSLAKMLKELSPDINIIFVTGYSEYMADALSIHASGYLLKPVTKEKIEAELEDLRRPVPVREDAVLRVKCFGNFDVINKNGESVLFERAKAKEALAYLIFRCGASCTKKEIASILFEEGRYDRRQQDYVQKILSSMMATLKSVGAQDAVNKKHNSLNVEVSLIDCDYYRFLKMDAAAVNSYFGEFMAQYSWAEFVTGYIENVYRRTIERRNYQ